MTTAVPLDSTDIDAQLRAQLCNVLARFPAIDQALVFGSVAMGTATAFSDLDIAAAFNTAPMSPEQKLALIAALAQSTGRPIDLIDLNAVGEPLLGQILRHGRRLMGSNDAYAGLLSRHLFENTDFMPHRSRILAERRLAWIGS